MIRIRKSDYWRCVGDSEKVGKLLNEKRNQEKKSEQEWKMHFNELNTNGKFFLYKSELTFIKKMGLENLH